MRRSLLVLTLLVGVLFTIGAAPAVSSAANCTNIHESTTWYNTSNGFLNFDARVWSCTGVDAVQFKNDTSFRAGWQDHSTGSFIRATVPTGIFQSGGGPCCQANYTLTYSHLPWCPGQVHVIDTVYYFRIHNYSLNTWGSWFARNSGNYAINC